MRTQNQENRFKKFADFLIQNGGFVMSALIFTIGCRLTSLQNSSTTRLLAEGQQIRTSAATYDRRAVKDRNQLVSAIDTTTQDLYVHSVLCKKDLSVLSKDLSIILGIPEDRILEKIQSAPTGVVLQHQITIEQAKKLVDLLEDGIELVARPRRQYPYRGSLADVTGYVDMDHIGQAGIELTYDTFLFCDGPNLSWWGDGRGRMLGKKFYEPLILKQEEDLYLTIDATLNQTIAESLEEAQRKFQAKRVGAIVMDVDTGAILAMASAPTYDPNEYHNFSFERFRCWLTHDLVEPGSTFKPVNVAIALEAHAVTPTDRIEDSGRITVGTEEILNVGVSKQIPTIPTKPSYLTPSEILQRSSNVGMVKMMQKLSPAEYYAWLQRLQLGGNMVNVDFPNMHMDSILKSKEEFCNYPIEPAVASFGQGLSMTALKLIQLHAALANGGYLVTPHIVNTTLPTLNDNIHKQVQQENYSDTLYFGHVPIPSREGGWINTANVPMHAKRYERVFSPQTTRAVLNMLDAVVLDRTATGHKSFLPGYAIGGKTGTAEKASPSGGYHDNLVVTSFVGFYPSRTPKYVTLVMIDEPGAQYGFASNTAAQLTQLIFSNLTYLLREEPTYPQMSTSEWIPSFLDIWKPNDQDSKQKFKNIQRHRRRCRTSTKTLNRDRRLRQKHSGNRKLTKEFAHQAVKDLNDQSNEK